MSPSMLISFLSHLEATKKCWKQIRNLVFCMALCIIQTQSVLLFLPLWMKYAIENCFWFWRLTLRLYPEIVKGGKKYSRWFLGWKFSYLCSHAACQANFRTFFWELIQTKLLKYHLISLLAPRNKAEVCWTFSLWSKGWMWGSWWSVRTEKQEDCWDYKQTNRMWKGHRMAIYLIAFCGRLNYSIVL